MTRYYVISPSYGYVDVILDDGTGPWEEGCDVVEVEASTKREAIAKGVAEMRANPRSHGYFEEAWEGDTPPWKGFTAESFDDFFEESDFFQANLLERR